MEMTPVVFWTWLGLSLFSISSMFLSLKLWHVPLKDQKSIIKSIIYSFLLAFVIFLIPIILEIIFPLPKDCPVLQKAYVVNCGKAYINWHYIQVISIIAYSAVVFGIWVIWDIFYGKLHKLPVKFPLRLARMLRTDIGLLSFLMMLPLAWLRNFLLDIFIK